MLSALFDIYEYVAFHWSPGNPNATGLVIIAFADLVLAIVSLMVSRFVLPIVASSILTTSLLLGDLLTIRFLHTTSSSFALGLIVLVAFDALLITQFLIGIASLLTSRSHPTIRIETDGSNRDRDESRGLGRIFRILESQLLFHDEDDFLWSQLFSQRVSFR